jgi:hypothetical protein
MEKVCGLVTVGKNFYLNHQKLTDELSSQHRANPGMPYSTYHVGQADYPGCITGNEASAL